MIIVAVVVVVFLSISKCMSSFQSDKRNENVLRSQIAEERRRRTEIALQEERRKRREREERREENGEQSRSGHRHRDRDENDSIDHGRQRHDRPPEYKERKPRS